MNLLEYIEQETERLVAEKLPSVLFDSRIYHHAKHGFKYNCSCSYCILKKEATKKIPESWKNWRNLREVSSTLDNDDIEYLIWKVRRRTRLMYRKRLRELRDFGKI